MAEQELLAVQQTMDIAKLPVQMTTTKRRQVPLEN